MPDASCTSDPLVCFLGSNLSLMETLHTRLAEHLINLRSAENITALRSAAGAHAAIILIVELDGLPVGRTVSSVLDRLEGDTGCRPELLCLVGQALSAERSVEACHEAFATFQAPFDTALIVARVLEWVAARTVRRQRVLIVDGLPEEGDAIQAILRGAGLSADQATEPRQVVRALEQSPTDLVLLDLNLPGGASRRLTDAIRGHALLFNLPILFLSAAAAPQQQGELLRLGGDEYLARPVAAEQLLAAVRGRLASVADAPADRPRASDGAKVPQLLSQTQLIKRLDQAILNHAVPAVGQAVLFVRPDDSAALAALDAAGRDQVLSLVFELVCRQAGGALLGGSLCEDGCYAWLHCAGDAELIEVANLICKSAKAMPLPARIGQVSLSIGMGFFTPPLDNALTLISRAEAAGEQARKAGGNRVHRDSGGRRPAAAGAPILELLQRALNGSGFRLVYQPIVSLRTSTHERYEVLLRLRTPHGEIMPPLTFLPVAAEHGLLPALDRWVLAGALATLRAERDTGRRTRLMIHQTAASLAEPGWLAWLRDEIVRLHLIRQRPVLEFNARDILADEGQARLLFPELARLGIEICLAGVTDTKETIELISRLRIGFVKLARELVDRESGARLNGLVGRMHGHGPQVIAAGIEDPEAIGRVWSSGVDFIQGNFIQFPEETLNFQFHEEVLG